MQMKEEGEGRRDKSEGGRKKGEEKEVREGRRIDTEYIHT